MGLIYLPESTLRTYALEAIEGVGDAALGQWEEMGNNTYHVRRRLTLEEQKLVGDVTDVRNTREHEERLIAIRKVIPPQFHHLRS